MDKGNSRRQRQGGISALLMLLAASFCSSAAFAAGPTLHFDIPAGDSVKSLSLFNTQSKIEMLYITDQVQGRTTRALAGEITLTDALQMLLDGTDLEFQFENDYTFVSIKPKPKRGRGPDHADGNRSGRRCRRTRAAICSSWRIRLARRDLEEVVVTGTLMHGVLDIMSPLSVVTRKRLKQTGYATCAGCDADVAAEFRRRPERRRWRSRQLRSRCRASICVDSARARRSS